jgi:hypothetical protein
MCDAFNFQPLIIIGAPRSGTNLLRDLLTAFPGVTTWSCDEINLVWRRNNSGWPNDALPTELASDRVRRYIRRAFARQARRAGAHTVVEKTCANALRVDFVDRVLPEGRFIHIVRDGRDAVASALGRWQAPFDLGYTLRKARYAPPAELPFHAIRYFSNRFSGLLHVKRRLRSWGPRFRGIDRWLATQPLADVASEQWRQCVLQASKSLARLPACRVATVRYEALATNPAAELTRLLRFAEIPYESRQIADAVHGVSSASIGRWRTSLDMMMADRLAPLIEETLRMVFAPNVDRQAA